MTILPKKLETMRDQGAQKYQDDKWDGGSFADQEAPYFEGFNAASDIYLPVVKQLMDTVLSVKQTSSEHSEKWEWCDSVLTATKEKLGLE